MFIAILLMTVQCDEIIKPLVHGDIQYKYLKLQNELKVLLIHDPNTEMANAALDVKAGSWNEPKEFPGLAHLCEHMLFMGSAKYPRNFDELLAKGSGSSNAYTDSTNTNYYFEIQEALEKALDVFAHFFIDPLFKNVDSEKNAVNSEYEIDVSSEEWKVQNLLTLLSKPDHPASRFSIGNAESLKNTSPEQLRKFYNQYYSSNVMSLVVRSRFTLQEMEKFITPFNNIENKHLKIVIFDKPYQFGILGKFKSEKTQVNLIWQLSGREQYSHEKPIEMIDYFLKNGDLFDYLKEKQLIIDYQTQVFSEESSYVIYMIEFTLGSYESSIPLQLSQIVNNYINQLVQWISDDEYLQEIFQERKKISQINFDYMDEQIDVSTLAKNLNTQPAEEVLTTQLVIDKLNKNLLLKYCGELRDTNNLLILVGNKNFKYSKETNNKQFSDTLNRKSDLYRIEYATQKLEQNSNEINLKFNKPQKNEFIPNKLNLISLCKNSGKLPKIVHANQLKTLDHEDRLNLFLMSEQQIDQCEVQEKYYQKNNHYPLLLSKKSQFWWKSATSYKLPTVFGAVQFLSPHHLGVREKTSLKLYNFLADQQLTKELKQPLSSGYSYDLEMNKGVEIKIYGFSEHVRNFFKKICSCMNPFRDKSKSFLEITESDNFNQAKQQMVSSIKEIYQQPLFEQAMQVYLPSILTLTQEPEQLLKQIESISEQQMIEDVRSILSNSQSSSLFVGNLDESDANNINEEVKKCQNTHSHQQHTFKIVYLHKGNFIYPKFVDDPNGVTLNYYQIGKRTSENYALMKLLQPILNQQAYNYLRTDLQLGYVVAAQFKSFGCIDGAMIIVQGNTELPMKVNKLIDQFTDRFQDYLHEMSKREYEHLKHSVAIELKEKPQSLIDEGERLWNHIKIGNLEFEERIVAAERLSSITKKQLIDFYQSVFVTNRSKLSLQFYGQIIDIENQDATIFKQHEMKYYECSSEVTQI